MACGFALYLNRRVVLEGWDVELGLRRLALRQRMASGTPALAAVAACLLAGAMLLAGPGRALAATEIQPPRVESSAPQALAETALDVEAEAPTEAKAAANTVLDDSDYVPRDTPAHRAAREIISAPLYGGEREVERWKSRSESPKPRAQRDGNSRDFLRGLFGVMAELLRVLAWLALAVLVVWLIRLLLNISLQKESASHAPKAPTTLFGLAIAPESLPADIAEAARRALAAGNRREALSLLYRGALSHLLHQRGLRIGRGATERDVLAAAVPLLQPSQSVWLTQLLDAWIAAAYAGRLPPLDAVTALIDGYALSLPARDSAAVETVP